MKIDYTNFREFYLLKGWKQKRLAEKIGIDPSTLSNRIRRGMPLDGAWIITIKECLGLTAEEVDWLLLGGDEPDRTKEKSEAETVGEIILNALKGARL